jgi:hypothetical protein
MRILDILFIVITVCFCLVWLSCAGQVPPDGGPRDLTPPEIIGVFPEPNSTNVRTNVIRFQFSKYVDRRSFQQALFISPIIDDMEVVWKGRSVELNLHDGLRGNTTYSVTVGTDVRDTREGNRLRDSFTLAFSTGDAIDSGMITGQVFYDDPVGVLIFAYEITDSVTADTLNPSEQEPDYITQTGENGKFRLPYLRMGTYRLIALRDEFQNRLYDRDVDPYGLYIRDVTLTEERPQYDGVSVRMHKPDLTRPFISRVDADHHRRVAVRFSKPVDPASITLQSFRIERSGTDAELPIVGYSVRKDPPSSVYLFTEVQDSVEYLLTVDTTVTDRFGNMLPSDDTTERFRGNPNPPDIPVAIEYRHPSADQMNVQPGTPVIIQFSEPVQSGKTEQAFRMADTSDVDIHGTFTWEDEATLVFSPVSDYASRMRYTVHIELDSLPAQNGLIHADSVFVSRFTSVDRNMLGTIEGELTSGKDIGYTIRVEPPGTADEQQRFQVSREGAGPFVVRNVPEGEYVIWAFEDPEMMQRYAFGTVFPFAASAPFTVYPDTVRVRARWSVDGIVLHLTP